jgi:hypothetical protein
VQDYLVDGPPTSSFIAATTARRQLAVHKRPKIVVDSPSESAILNPAPNVRPHTYRVVVLALTVERQTALSMRTVVVLHQLMQITLWAF